MRLKSLLRRVETFKSFVFSDARLEDEEIRFPVKPRKGTRGLCSSCLKPGPTYDHLDIRRFLYVPFWGYPVIFLYAMRRIQCRDCGIKVEQVPWAEGKSPVTTSMRLFLASWARDLPWKRVAERFKVGWRTVYESVRYVVDWGRARLDLTGLTAIGVDEVHIGKTHSYLTLVYQLDSGMRRLLFVGKGKNAKTLAGFFDSLDAKIRVGIRFACTDMAKQYLQVIREKIPHALNILDRFHIMTNFGKVLDRIRAREARTLAQEGYSPVLKRSRYCFLKRPENLKPKEKSRLREILKYDLKSVRAYLLKESFQAFWTYTHPSWAEWFFDRWCTRALQSRLPEMRKLVGTLREHKPLILNWFTAKKEFSSAAVEASNNVVKTSLKMAYGYRSMKVLKTRLFHVLGGLPEPEGTHRFC